MIDRNGTQDGGAVAALEHPIEVSGLVKSFGGVRAVGGFSFAVPKGSIYGVLGPNGAGKTTVLNLLNGVFRPDAGTVSLLGEDVTGWPAFRIARLGLARTYQNIRLAPGLTTLETVMAGAFTRGKAGLVSILLRTPGERNERKAIAAEGRELLARVGVQTDPKRLARTLPYGEQRRVEIARALASHPRVLLLDEPTAGMNWAESSSLGNLLRELVADGLTIVLIEHNMRLVREYCDWATVMQSGEVLAEGDPASCLARDDVQEAYFGRKVDAARIKALRRVRIDSSR